MKKLPTFRPSLVTKEFFPSYKNVAEINMGECFIWAYAAYCMFDYVHLWHLNCHAFVKYRGRFYDSEVLKGSPYWQDLPATEGGDYPAAPASSVQYFKTEWGSPKVYGITWAQIEKKAEQAIRKYGRMLRT